MHVPCGQSSSLYCENVRYEISDTLMFHMEVKPLITEELRVIPHGLLKRDHDCSFM